MMSLKPRQLIAPHNVSGRLSPLEKEQVNMESTVTSTRLLVVSRDSATLRTLWSAMESNGWQIDVAGSAWEAMDKMRSDAELDMLVIDLPVGHADGVAEMRSFRRLRPDLPIMLIDQTDDLALRQKAIWNGAQGYLAAPFSKSDLENSILRSLSLCETVDNGITSDHVEKIDDEIWFVALSQSMRRLRSQVGMLAETDLPVYISGESGAGKETVARLLHRLSVRSGFAFAKIDCTALPEDLLEEEIFGSTAVTADGKCAVRRGKLERSGKGRVYLHEITRMSLRLQSKLARAVLSGKFVRRGSDTPIGIDVTIAASGLTNADRAVAEGRFDADLCRLLGAYEVRVPPLRERKEEIPSLSRHFMHRAARKYGLAAREFSNAVLNTWQNRSWLGNLRELEQSVKRYLVAGDEILEMERLPSIAKAGDSPDIATCDLNRSTLNFTSSASLDGIAANKSLRVLLQSVREEAERSAIAMALEKTGWNRKAAARLLKTSYRTVLYKIEQYKMSPSGYFASAQANGTESGLAELDGANQKRVPKKCIREEGRGG
jgi:two-component system response regulator AtoC